MSPFASIYTMNLYEEKDTDLIYSRNRVKQTWWKMKRKKIYVVDMEIVNPHGYKSSTTPRCFLCGCVALHSSKVDISTIFVEMKFEYDQKNMFYQ